MTILTSLVHQAPIAIVIAFVLIGVLGVGRLTRLITHDAFPPAAWLRNRWSTLTRDSDWSLLFRCFWCLPPWLMLGCIGWFIGGTRVPWLGWAWLLFWGWLALSYLASMVVARDEPAE